MEKLTRALEKVTSKVDAMEERERKRRKETNITDPSAPRHGQAPGNTLCPLPTSLKKRCSVPEELNKQYAAQRVMLPEEVESQVNEVMATMQQNDIEVEVTWFPVGGRKETATTWRGTVEDNGDEENPIIVSYPWGNYPLPNSNVCYTRIVISASEPKMPGKLPESDDETAPSEETNDSFNLRDVITWNTYITQGPLGIKILKQRLRTALDLPSRMSPQLQALWDILCAWIDDSAERGGVNSDAVNHKNVGQSTVDQIRILQGIYRGADARYIRSQYVTQKDPQDRLGNVIEQSVTYNQATTYTSRGSQRTRYTPRMPIRGRVYANRTPINRTGILEHGITRQATIAPRAPDFRGRGIGPQH